jgi:hypothetical protein
MHDGPRGDGPLAHATLHRGADRGPAIDALVALGAERVGLEGVLGHLNRTGERALDRLSGLTGVAEAFTWQAEDRASRRWWPQGITTSADAVPDLDRDGRSDDPPVLLTSAYAKPVRGVSQGSRVSVVDLSDPARPRYRQVLLVDVRLDKETGAPTLGPVKAHAGGIVWHGPWLHVAATARGFWTFRLDDLLRVDPLPDGDRIGVSPDGLGTHGYRYVLPVRFAHASRTAEGGGEPLRFSFLSRSHGDADQWGGPELLAGEYGHGSMTTRLWHYALDRETQLLDADDEGVSRPRLSRVSGVARMQGAVVAHGRMYVTTSRGRLRRGSLWVERDGVLREQQYATPPGPEDIAYWPARDQLWSLSEHPHSRYVFALDRRRLG